MPIDSDLLELLVSEDYTDKKETKSGESADRVGAIDPLFEDAYDDFKSAANSRDAAEAFRLMLRLLKD